MAKTEKGWTDGLSTDEVYFSIQSAQKLRTLGWTKKLLNDKKISHALQVQSDPKRTYSDLNEIKSALFEVRFAYALHTARLEASYEFRTNVANTSVDFKVQRQNATWLIELTSLRESNAVKEATSIDEEGYYQFLSIDRRDGNSVKVVELIKLQNAIYNKMCKSDNSGIIPIKFPSPSNQTYNIIVVDSRSLSSGITDYYDFAIAVYGSNSVKDICDGIFCRQFRNRQTGQLSPLQGIFEETNNHHCSTMIRERIHFVCFIHEKTYTENEIFDEMMVFKNPKYFTSDSDVEKIWPFKIN
ncbi:hypothetical protein [Legionella spiritensis]|uniref:hypothetical protein n=1 Tax=Legionella spiritensis TaxID=452 RepID=UPI000F6BBC70|nr:hypothetical protein [Legionella spiritensis]VEG91212.1 Uncharacterised protein [Legionella spiritensis]